MFDVINKENKKVKKAYSVIIDENGETRFLTYNEDVWWWEYAQDYTPLEIVKQN